MNTETQKRRLDNIGSFVKEKRCYAGTVRELLETKGNDVWTISPDEQVFMALKLMAKKNVGALVIMGSGRVIGLMSERDYARKIILVGKTSREAKVNEIMSRPVMTVSPDESVEECMALMTERYLRHLPVVEDARLVGLVSIGDLVKQVIIYQAHRISQYEGYIAGNYPA